MVSFFRGWIGISRGPVLLDDNADAPTPIETFSISPLNCLTPLPKVGSLRETKVADHIAISKDHVQLILVWRSGSP